VGLKSAKEIFSNRFYGLRVAAVQKVEANEKNLRLLSDNVTGDWPALRPETDIIALAFMRGRTREFWVGRLIEQRPSPRFPSSNLYEFEVDRFELIGVHDLDEVSDANFYATGGGGGSRVYVNREGEVLPPTPRHESLLDNAPGEDVRRLIWMRRNHHLFRDVVRQAWAMKCAVTGTACNGLLVASHILPWSRSTPTQKTDVNNGLLLSAPWDALFDRGLIGFADDGALVVSKRVSDETRRVFGISKNARLTRAPNAAMRKYLAMHRELYALAP